MRLVAGSDPDDEETAFPRVRFVDDFRGHGEELTVVMGLEGGANLT